MRMTYTPKKTRRRVILYMVVAVLLTTIAVRIFIVDSFTVGGSSMAPTIQNGDYIFVNKMAYYFSDPKRDDIVVGNFRDMDDIKVVKRIVALPREWITIEGNVVSVRNSRDGELHTAHKLFDDTLLDHASTTPFAYRLDPYEYLLLGDNGLGSVDSRELGPVDKYKIDGRVFLKVDLSTMQFVWF